jgi:hypothetical protein
MKKSKVRQKFYLRGGAKVCLGGALLAAHPQLFAQAAPESGNVTRMENLEKENKELKRRLDSLEALAKKEGLAPSGDAPTKPITALSQIQISGFVQGSYFYDTSEPNDNSPNGYLWNRQHNSFSINKVKLTVASPGVERSGDTWDAGYRASLIFGEDAPIVNTGGERQGLEDLREAYVELNVPIGEGLNVKAGQLISLLNFESGDGGVVNPNFSQGYQWFFTGNGPSAGVQLGYAFNDLIDVKARVQNGLYAGAVDNNGFKTFMGSVGIKPDDKTSVSLIGFGGREGADNSDWLKGGQIIASRQLMDDFKLNGATELSYFSLDVDDDTADWYSVGGWLWADFTPKLGLALRGEWIGDPDGAGTGGLLGFPAEGAGDLYSATLTLNLRPVPGVKIQPEIRYDHASHDGAFDGEEDRFIVGAGISYAF